MHKILGSWSGMRKYLEEEMLAECLHGRIRYGCTTYVGMDDLKVFEVCVDGRQVKRFSWETVNSYFIANGCKKESKVNGGAGYWEDFHVLLNEIPLRSRTEYTDEEFCSALSEYRNQNIQASIRSDNPIIKMFAVLDRRTGKRTLADMSEAFLNEPEWLQIFYKLRTDAENIQL